MKTAIVGLGYVGLPLSFQFARSGVTVLGLDIDTSKVDALNQGKSYIKHISAESVAEATKSGAFSASTDFSRIKEVSSIIICVPTPLNKNREPDISYILDTGKNIARHLQKGMLVVLESTTYPGTTDQDLREVLEIGSGLEAAKLLENTFRGVNIALVNELKVVYDAMGIDVWEVINAAKTKPFGFMPFYPGTGLGGHCIPIDPFYLTWKAREYGQNTRFIELAGEINTSMPEYVVRRVADALNDAEKAVKGSSILILGLAYKPNVDDERESPSYFLMEMLKARGAKVAYYDPYVPVIRPTREHAHWTGTKSVEWKKNLISTYDLVLIATNHASVNYQELADW